MARRLVVAVGLALVAGGSMTACGGSEDEPSVAPTTAAPTSASSSPTESVDATAYLPVPVGVTLTAPGSELKIGDPVVGAWMPRQDLIGVVEIEVTRVEVTTIEASLDSYDLDDIARASTPYFVRAKVTNQGDTDLGGRQLPLYVVDTSEALLAPTGIGQSYVPCPGSSLPAIFAPGDEAKTCLIFLVPEGSTLVSVMFRPPEGIVPLTWSGKIRPLKAEPKDGDGKGRKDP